LRTGTDWGQALPIVLPRGPINRGGAVVLYCWERN
jgi:hypothetical protein